MVDTNNIEEDEAIKARLNFKEQNIKKISAKYLELIAKFNSNQKPEAINLIKDIINELEFLEISVQKAENLEKLKEIDIPHHKDIGKKVENSRNEITKEIISLSACLKEEKKNKENKNNCEEIAKVINSYKNCLDLQK